MTRTRQLSSTLGIMDPAEVFGETIWHWIRRIFIFTSALVFGGSLGEVIREAGSSHVTASGLFYALREGPEWILGSILSSIGPLVIGILCVFVISSWSGYWWWYGAVALVSANVISHRSNFFYWSIWFLLMVSLAAGVRTLRLWQRNKWANELEGIRRENSWRLANLEAEARVDDDSR